MIPSRKATQKDKQNRQNVTTPKVSVLLPNLNNRRFLEERVQTVLDQTLEDWELIIVDGYSDDGAWELIQKFAARDARIRISQAPREGIYAGLNRCIHLAQGKYIYIATSDDTMSPDCLEKMVAAMDAHPECEICHTCLKIIDEKGNEIPNSWRTFPAARFYGNLIDKLHIRFAPYDGILHCALYMIYSSLTQLLIRRLIFEKVGLFRTSWGTIGDFEWGMRASLVCHTLHLPETLATWRVHSNQATAEAFIRSAKYRTKLCEMITAALPILQTYNPEFYKKIRIRRLLFPYRREQFMLGVGECRNWGQKIVYMLDFLLKSPRSVSEFLGWRFFRKRQRVDDFTYIREELERLGLSQDQWVKVLE